MMGLHIPLHSGEESNRAVPLVVYISTLRSTKSVQEGREILAFADDLVLLASSSGELQELLQITTEALDQISLKVNTGAQCTYTFKGSAQLTKVYTPFLIDEQPLKILEDGITTRQTSRVLPYGRLF
ncbi:hypothetical protein TNIN_104841 [Trichonephila inaurata madagascariensis]|uniref:Reverse transcriptase domain-containing protein n=1 Tax=Trichonephila inaurata madagascariensis TaxID=2747483 RepID=A0A8X6X7N1_9ARAC|nr:hypothetical protein TNIN_104841 [Trichonephila inaurata madagascariensis]